MGRTEVGARADRRHGRRQTEHRRGRRIWVGRGKARRLGNGTRLSTGLEGAAMESLVQLDGNGTVD